MMKSDRISYDCNSLVRSIYVILDTLSNFAPEVSEEAYKKQLDRLAKKTAREEERAGFRATQTLDGLRIVA